MFSRGQLRRKKIEEALVKGEKFYQGRKVVSSGKLRIEHVVEYKMKTNPLEFREIGTELPRRFLTKQAY